jgi:hypothetical protein
MQNNNYNLPKSKAGKNALLKAIATGKKNVDDLNKEDEITVNMYLAGDGSFPPDWGRDPNATYVTLNIQ